MGSQEQDRAGAALAARVAAALSPQAVLGVLPSASAPSIRRAYRDLALKLHPDKCRAAGAEEAFKKVQAAFEALAAPTPPAPPPPPPTEGAGRAQGGSNGGWPPQGASGRQGGPSGGREEVAGQRGRAVESHMAAGEWVERDPPLQRVGGRAPHAGLPGGDLGIRDPPDFWRAGGGGATGQWDPALRGVGEAAPREPPARGGKSHHFEVAPPRGGRGVAAGGGAVRAPGSEREPQWKQRQREVEREAGLRRQAHLREESRGRIQKRFERRAGGGGGGQLGGAAEEGGQVGWRERMAQRERGRAGE